MRDFEHVTAIMVTHQPRDAFYVATHEAVRENGRVAIVRADQRRDDEAEFLMLKDGRIRFVGNVAELRATTDPYVRRFAS